MEQEDNTHQTRELKWNAPLYNRDKNFDHKQNDTILSQLEIQQKLKNDSAMLLQIHQRQAHIPFKRLQLQAKQGVLSPDALPNVQSQHVYTVYMVETQRNHSVTKLPRIHL